MQAVPYSREFKQKYDYFRKKLKKPVRTVFPFKHICLVFVVLAGELLRNSTRTKLNLVKTTQQLLAQKDELIPSLTYLTLIILSVNQLIFFVLNT